MQEKRTGVHGPQDGKDVETSLYDSIKEGLLARGIMYALIEHEPVYTMEQATEVCQNPPKQGVKVLFLKYYQTHSAYATVLWSGLEIRK